MKASVGGKYESIRDGDIDLEKEEKVTVLNCSNGYAEVRKEDGRVGKCPSYYLTIDELPGKSFADQIQYRRDWLEKIDGTLPSTSSNIGFLTSQNDENEDDMILKMEVDKCDSPIIVEELKDVETVEGKSICMQPVILSNSNFTITWHGPAVDSKRARIQSNNQMSRLIIENVRKEDTGAYSAIARNSFGVTSTVAFVNVRPIPEPPSDFECKIIRDHEIRLKWKFEIGMKYCIEYRHLEDQNGFETAAVNLIRTHVELRNFQKNQYIFRVFAYNQNVRSGPSKCIHVDFGKSIVFDYQ